MDLVFDLLVVSVAIELDLICDISKLQEKFIKENIKFLN
jgi:hypothetical protein